MERVRRAAADASFYRIIAGVQLLMGGKANNSSLSLLLDSGRPLCRSGGVRCVCIGWHVNFCSSSSHIKSLESTSKNASRLSAAVAARVSMPVRLRE